MPKFNFQRSADKLILETIERRYDEKWSGRGKDITEKDVDPKELAMGLEVEKEHYPDNEELRKRTALDHLAENPKYYSQLKKAGLADELE